MSIPAFRRTLTLTTLLLTLGVHAEAQQPKPTEKPAEKPAKDKADQEVKIPEIADEPKTIDPAQFVHKQLAAPVTVKFEESSLREIGQWIRENQKIPVLFDNQALSEEGIPLGTPLSERSDEQPLYLLLNRLSAIGLDWYVEDDILHITTDIVAEERMVTETYNLGDLLDAGFKRNKILETIKSTTSDPWEDVDGTGGTQEWLGDVLFVRSTDDVQREVQGILAALRNHGRRTFTNDPPLHAALREKLAKNVSVEFDDVPLALAIDRLGRQAQTDFRLDREALREEGIHERQPVSLKLADRELDTVLRILLADFGLTWILDDGVVLITTEIAAEEHLKTAVFDVRDLCRNDQEVEPLRSAVMTQTSGPWQEIHGTGGEIAFARPGVMAVRQTERQLNEVLALLETYRKALRASKPRDREGEKGREVSTRYYRMHDGVAEDLTRLLPEMVEPETWKNDKNPKASGTIIKAASEPKLLDARGQVVYASNVKTQKNASAAFMISQSVLIIRQTQTVHEEISKVVKRIEDGDPLIQEPPAGGMGGQGGGGFGGGFFSVR